VAQLLLALVALEVYLVVLQVQTAQILFTLQVLQLVVDLALEQHLARISQLE
jgi:hypothetical protein